MAARTQQTDKPHRQHRAVKSAVRVLDILELMANEPQGLSIRGISERLQIPVSSTHALVLTLIDRGYLALGDDSLITIGPRVTQLGAQLVGRADIFVAAEPVLERAHQLCGETVCLAIPDGD